MAETNVPNRKSDRRASTRRFEYLVIEGITPELDGGRYPVKRIVGDSVVVGADILTGGAEYLAARVLYRGPEDDDWSATPMQYEYDTDRWYGAFAADRVGLWVFTIEAWTDRFSAWRAALQAKVEAGEDASRDLADGAQMARAASRSTRSAATRASLVLTAKVLEDRRGASVETRIHRALDEDFFSLMQDFRRPADLTRLRREIAVVADRERAGFAAWFIHSPDDRALASGDPGDPGDPGRGESTDDTAATTLARAATLGFDTVSFHPDDVGSLADFERVARKARELGLEIALDYELQCSPDHPWVSEHPDWFDIGIDGAPDTPAPSNASDARRKNAQGVDAYSLNLWCDDRDSLWNACREVLLSWIERGVRAFAVDDPQERPLAFWEWLIHEVQHDHPDVFFFARAHGRPKHVMNLAKAGFTMSYTYFPWKTSAPELRQYFTELTRPPAADYFRGNLIVNPSDIVNEYLNSGGVAAFRARLLLAGTLLPLYGVRGDCETTDERVVTDIRRLNTIRREQPALQYFTNLTFHDTDNPAILFYRKARRDHGDRDLLIALNTDPHHAHHTMVHVPIYELGISDEQPYVVHDLLTGARYGWRGSRNYVRLDPAEQAGHIFLVER